MGKAILVDVETKDRLVRKGTCERCYSSGQVSEPVFVFKDKKTGETLKIRGYYWDWGYYNSVYDVNITALGQWVKDMDIEFKDIRKWTFDDLNDACYKAWKKYGSTNVG